MDWHNKHGQIKCHSRYRHRHHPDRHSQQPEKFCKIVNSIAQCMSTCQENEQKTGNKKAKCNWEPGEWHLLSPKLQ